MKVEKFNLAAFKAFVNTYPIEPRTSEHEIVAKDILSFFGACIDKRYKGRDGFKKLLSDLAGLNEERAPDVTPNPVIVRVK